VLRTIAAWLSVPRAGVPTWVALSMLALACAASFRVGMLIVESLFAPPQTVMESDYRMAPGSPEHFTVRRSADCTGVASH